MQIQLPIQNYDLTNQQNFNRPNELKWFLGIECQWINCLLCYLFLLCFIPTATISTEKLHLKSYITSMRTRIFFKIKLLICKIKEKIMTSWTLFWKSTTKIFTHWHYIKHAVYLVNILSIHPCKFCLVVEWFENSTRNYNNIRFF